MARQPLAKDRRISKLARQLNSSELAGVVICPGPNLTYYTGVRAQLLERPFLLFVGRDGALDLLLPKLEAGPFRGTGLDLAFHEWDDTEGPGRAFEELLSRIQKGSWGCEGRVPFGFLDHLLRRGMKVEPCDYILQSIRAIKEPSELEAVRRSAKILVGAYLKIPGWLREGMTERELSRLVVEDVLANGGESMEMCMVQSGPRAADPHSETSSKKIARGESIVVDAVSIYEGYAADITRDLRCWEGPCARGGLFERPGRTREGHRRCGARGQGGGSRCCSAGFIGAGRPG